MQVFQNLSKVAAKFLTPLLDNTYNKRVFNRKEEELVYCFHEICNIIDTQANLGKLFLSCIHVLYCYNS